MFTLRIQAGTIDSKKFDLSPLRLKSPRSLVWSDDGKMTLIDAHGLVVNVDSTAGKVQWQRKFVSYQGKALEDGKVAERLRGLVTTDAGGEADGGRRFFLWEPSGNLQEVTLPGLGDAVVSLPSDPRPALVTGFFVAHCQSCHGPTSGSARFFTANGELDSALVTSKSMRDQIIDRIQRPAGAPGRMPPYAEIPPSERTSFRDAFEGR
jgi:hypothetical protein